MRPGDRVRLDHFASTGNPEQAFGTPFEEVRYNSSVGGLPAWYVKGSGKVWAIFVHGRVANREGRLEALNALPVAVNLGLPSLVISYRNDLAAPEDADGFHWFGVTEWEDVEGSVQYAIDHGAVGVVLVGYSMGGAAVTRFLYESKLAPRVRGVVLDSPTLDFGAMISHGASQKKLPLLGRIPGFIVSLAKRISSMRFGIDFADMNLLAETGRLKAPLPLVHGDSDREAPITVSDALAEARPDIVRYIRNPGVDHVRSWNAFRNEYERAVGSFVAELAK